MFIGVQRLFVLLAVCGFGIHKGSCADGNDAKNLRKQLFVTDGYDKKVRPSNNQSDPIGMTNFLILISVQ
jgi:hypothetical protein